MWLLRRLDYPLARYCWLFCYFEFSLLMLSFSVLSMMSLFGRNVSSPSFSVSIC